MAITPSFIPTFVNKTVHLIELLIVIGLQLWIWGETVQYTPDAHLFVSGVLLTIIASGPI